MSGLNQSPAKVPDLETGPVGSNPTLSAINKIIDELMSDIRFKPGMIKKHYRCDTECLILNQALELELYKIVCGILCDDETRKAFLDATRK